jgi:hypothetical protein
VPADTDDGRRRALRHLRDCLLKFFQCAHVPFLLISFPLRRPRRPVVCRPQWQ